MAPSSDWSISVFKTLEEIRSLETTWKSLQSPVTSFNLGTSFEYVLSGCEEFGGAVSYKEFGDSRSLRVLLLKNGETPVAISPFVKLSRRRSLGPIVRDITSLEWIGEWWGIDQFRSIIGLNRPEVAAKFLDWIYKHEKFDVLNLIQVRRDDPIVTGFESCLSINEPFPIIPLEYGTYDAHVKEGYSKAVRQLLRTARNHADKSSIRLEMAFEPFNSNFDEVIRLAKARIASGKGTQFEHEPFRRFMFNLSNRYPLEVLFLKANGKNVAYRLFAGLDKSLHCLDYSYDRAYAALQPGALLIDRALKEAYSRGHTSHAPGFGLYLNILRFTKSLYCAYKFTRPGNTAIAPLVCKLITDKARKREQYLIERCSDFATRHRFEYNEFTSR